MQTRTELKTLPVHPSTGSPSRAEIRVLELVALGLSSREIADSLWVSRQAITYHIGNLFSKLGAHSRAGLVARAYALGFLDPGTWPPIVQSDPEAPNGPRGATPDPDSVGRATGP